MKQKTILSRKFQRQGADGRVYRFTAQLVQSGNQKPYFSITTDHGADHEMILKVWPELHWLTRLHLTNEDGTPMHAAENLIYHAKNMDIYSIMRHLRCDGKTAKNIALEIACKREELKKQTREEVESSYKRFKKEVFGKAGEYLTGTTTHPFRDGHNKKTLSAILEDARKVAFLLEEWAANAKDYPTLYIIKDLEVFDTLGRIRGLLVFSNRRMIAEWEYQKVKNLFNELRTLLRSIDIQFQEKKDTIVDQILKERVREYVEKEILSHFEEKWREEAEKAKEFLSLPDSIEKPEISQGDPIIEVDGEAYPVSSIHNHGDLPIVDLGFAEYMVAPDRKTAGEAAKNYWRTMAEDDPSEFTAIVGEDTLTSWSLGKTAGPGSVKVSSFNEWLEVVAENPHETFASYDGKEHQGYINKKLADDLGFTFKPNDLGKMPVILYWVG